MLIVGAVHRYRIWAAIPWVIFPRAYLMHQEKVTTSYAAKNILKIAYLRLKRDVDLILIVIGLHLKKPDLENLRSTPCPALCMP